MKSFPGYESVSRIGEDGHSAMYRARPEGLGGTVLIKDLRINSPSPAEIARFMHEYQLIGGLTMDGIVKPLGIIRQEDGLALVLEDFDGAPLTDHIRDGIPLERFLALAVRLSEILGALHQEGVTHRDIKPGTILLGRQDDGLKLTDFGMAAEITRITEEIYAPSVVEGMLPYMSPEQTGRINCPVDYRSDLYSLGVTFYQMLTGTVPFMAKDPLEIIHAHIAKAPVPPVKIREEIPEVLSDIVLRLLAKAPEERYQNSFGLVHDLSACLSQLKNTGRVKPFELGRKDVSLKFNIPQVVVGRDEDIALLFDAFERVSTGSLEVMLVTGEPGIGKSALVGEVRKPIVAKKGYFIPGKYDQLRRYVPYKAIIQAFQGLARQLLTESGDRIALWRRKLIEALGPNGRIITDAIPEMELIVGKQPDIPELGIEENQNRFTMVFKNFVKVFATREHPLVLYLDDLQWADSASLALIEAIATDRGLSHLLLIGAYRDNEVGPHHPFMLTLEALLKRGTAVRTLKLSPLDGMSVNRIISNFLRCGPDVSASLAMVVHEKTLGNPFFVIQFLKTLYEDKHIIFNASRGWQWDTGAIQEMQVTDNVVDLMAAKIVRLPETQRALIEVCSCIGNRFDIETLSSIMEKSIDEVLYTMDDLIRLGLINFSSGLYRFHHDRIQEAAYSLIPPGDLEKLHYRIGRRLLEITPEDEYPARIFSIADQFNQARGLVQRGQERELVAGLNLKAGMRAKDSMAYGAAADYLLTGMKLLSGNAWKDQYELTFALHLERMECEYLIRNFDEAERIFSDLVRNARDTIGRAKACTAMVVLYTNMGKPIQAIDLGIESVRMFGVRMNRNAGKGAVLRELVRLKLKLRKIRIEDVLDMPRMTDEEKIRTAELYSGIGLPAYYTNPNLFAVTVLKGVNMDMVHGVTHTTAFGFLAISTILASALGEYETAYKISEMALRLNEKHDEKRYACKVNFIFAFLILHWMRPMKDAVDYYLKAYKEGLVAGDLIYCGHCITAMNMSRVIMGDNIDEVMKDHAKFRDFIEGIKDPFVASEYDEIRQLCLYLKGQTKGPGSLDTDDYSLEKSIAAARERNNPLYLFFLLLSREKVSYLSGLWEEAYQAGFEADTLLEVPMGAYHVSEHVFYRCMSLLAVYPGKPAGERRKILRTLRKHTRMMKRWAQLCPANIGHKYLLVRAETAAVAGRFQEACELYEQAVTSACEHENPYMEALANERAGLFYKGRRLEKISRMYLQAAHQAYARWGAAGRMRELEKAHPFLAMKDQKQRVTGDASSDSSTGTASSLLDLSTVMQVSQAISGEIMLDRLLGRIMKMAIINAGAQKGFFILDGDGHLTIEAAGEGGGEDVKVMQSVPVEACPDLSSAIVHYVHRSGENVILGNASQEGPFVSDPYVMRNKCKSILATPVMSKGKPLGLLYMENNLAVGAFTPDRLEFLRIISSQAAISLDNARLFDLATTDGLTKLFVHRYFQLLLDQEVQRSKRSLKPFSLVMMDIDDFKHFNDTYGHQMGDEVLRRVARTIKASTRAVDIASRYGGEEFVLILPETDAAGALIVAEKVRKAVEDIAIPFGDESLTVTVSSGLATFPFNANNKDALIGAADAALYLSKRSGKNCVSVRE